MIEVVDVLGINDNNMIIVEYNKGSLPQSMFRAEGNGVFLSKLKNKEFNISMLILGGEHLSVKFKLPKNAILFNSIGVAEGHIKSLNQFSNLLSRTPCPVINNPESVLSTSRDQIANRLSGIKGIIIPKCQRLTPLSIQNVDTFIGANSFSFPILFRPVVEHGAASLIRIDTPKDLGKLHRFAFDGTREYYVTQFLNYRSKDKLYRKLRFLIIGDEVIPRHLILSSSWQIHTESRNMPKEIKNKQEEEEIEFLRKIDISIGLRLLAIKKTLGLDYVGIDCAIGSRGNIITFEINPYSMIGQGKNEIYHQETISHTYNALSRLIREKATTLQDASQ